MIVTMMVMFGVSIVTNAYSHKPTYDQIKDTKNSILENINPS